MKRRRDKWRLPKGMQKFTLLASLFLLAACNLTACDQNKSLAAQDASGGSGRSGNNSEKLTTGVPPQYNSKLFKIGQAWTWQKNVPNSKKPPCQRWQIVDSTNSGVTVEERNTIDCSTFEKTDWIQYVFNPFDGHITQIRTATGWSDQTKDRTVFHRFYGDESTKTYIRKVFKLKTKNIQAFQIQGAKSWYIEAPEQVNNGVLLQDENWTLVLE